MTKPLEVWVVDDDASIRWVLERALRQGGLMPTTFDHADAALAALATRRPDVLITDVRMPGTEGLRLLEIAATRPSGTAGDRDDRARGPRPRGRRVSWRRLRVPAEALRHRRGRGARAPCLRARQRPRCGRGKRADPGHPRAGAGDAGGLSRDRPALALEPLRARDRRVRHRQGARRARPAPAQPARERALHRAQHLGDRLRAARVRAVRPRAGRIHRRGRDAPRALRTGRRRDAVPRRDRRHERARCRCACCACSRRASSTASAATSRSGSTCA